MIQLEKKVLNFFQKNKVKPSTKNAKKIIMILDQKKKKLYLNYILNRIIIKEFNKKFLNFQIQ